MKKKFHIYCVLFLLSVGCGIAIDVITGYKEMVQSFNAGWHGEEEPYNDINVTFRPKSFRTENATFGTDSVYNVITKEKEAVHFNNAVVHVGKDKVELPSFADKLIGLGSLLYVVGILGFWYIFVGIVRSFNDGEVFHHFVASRIMKTSVFLLVMYLAQWIITWGWNDISQSMVQIEGYEIVPHFQYNNSYLYTAFGLMLLAQIIKHGKELKEENELTI